jgi:hypothetical protein
MEEYQTLTTIARDEEDQTRLLAGYEEDQTHITLKESNPDNCEITGIR